MIDIETQIMITVNRKVFVLALKKLATVVENHSSIPILSYVTCRVSAGKMTLVGTDLDIELSVSIDAEGDGCFTFPLFQIQKLAVKMWGETFTFEKLDDLKYRMTSETANFTFHTLAIEDFPELKIGEPTCKITAPAGVLHGALSQVQHAISAEETRYYLNGVYLDFARGDFVAVATDGARLALASLPVQITAGACSGVIVPRKTVSVFLKCFPHDEVTIKFEGTKAKFAFNGVTMVSKLIDRTFPNYTRVIPKHVDGMAVITILADELARGVSVAMMVTLGNMRRLEFTFDRTNMTLALLITNPDYGQADILIPLKSHVGADFASIRFNARYVLDICKRYKGRELSIQLIDAESPCVIKSELTPLDGLSVLMPLRIQK
jgi:DNA polymerase III subunit beta